MTDLICIENPSLLIITAIMAAISLICALLPKNSAISLAAALLHAFALAGVLYFGGGLTDILLMLIVSLIVSVLSESIKESIKKSLSGRSERK